jgi:DNA modification methylase
MGSGTTAKMCILLNRNYIGSEISKDYVDICLERINITLKNK